MFDELVIDYFSVPSLESFAYSLEVFDYLLYIPENFDKDIPENNELLCLSLPLFLYT